MVAIGASAAAGAAATSLEVGGRGVGEKQGRTSGEVHVEGATAGESTLKMKEQEK